MALYDDEGRKLKRSDPAYYKTWAKQNHEHILEYNRRVGYARVNAYRNERRATDPEYRAKENAKANAGYHANREARLAQQKVYREKNAEAISERAKVYQAKYRAEHRDLCLARQKPHWRKNKAKRRSAQLQRTPLWADHAAIAFFYECAPAGTHVDHVIPLRGKKVSGLHVAENLQWLPDIDNLRKGNQFAAGLH